MPLDVSSICTGIVGLTIEQKTLAQNIDQCQIQIFHLCPAEIKNPSGFFSRLLLLLICNS